MTSVRTLSPLEFANSIPFDLLGKLFPGESLPDFMMSATTVVIIVKNETRAIAFIAECVDVPVDICAGEAFVRARAVDMGVDFEDHPNPFAR